jgi:hypothetical protein
MIIRAYNYLLFRIYKFYTDRLKQNDSPFIYVTSVSTIFIYINLFSLYGLLVYNNVFNDIIPGKYYVVIPLGIIWALNYFFFVKREYFLECNFKKDVKGGMLVVLYIFITISLFITIANYNRAKLFKQRREHPVNEQTKQTPSLEGKIRRLWNHNF